MNRLLSCIVAVLLGGIVAMWGVSEVSPRTLGTCHVVPLNIGKRASVTQCDSDTSTAFIVPLVVVAFLALFIIEDGFEIGLPGGFTFTKTGRAKRAVKDLRAEDLDVRSEQYLSALRESGARPPAPGDAGSEYHDG